MNNEVKQILEAVQRGEMNVDDALLRIKTCLLYTSWIDMN